MTSKGSDVKMVIQTNRRHDHTQSHKHLRTVYTFIIWLIFHRSLRLKNGVKRSFRTKRRSSHHRGEFSDREIFFLSYKISSFFICLFGVLLYWFVNYHSLRHVAQQNLKQSLLTIKMTKAYFLYLNRDHIYWDISSFLENVILLLQGSRRAVETMDDGHCADYLMKRLEEMLQKFQKISIKTDA